MYKYLMALLPLLMWTKTTSVYISGGVCLKSFPHPPVIRDWPYADELSAQRKRNYAGHCDGRHASCRIFDNVLVGKGIPRGKHSLVIYLASHRKISTGENLLRRTTLQDPSIEHLHPVHFLRIEIGVSLDSDKRPTV